MKNLKLMTQFVLPVALLLLVLTACNKEEIASAPIAEQIPAAHIAQLEAMHFNVDQLKISEVPLPDGTTQKSYLLEGDLAIPVAQIEAFLAHEVVGHPNLEQRSYSNLVTAPATLNVLGYTGGSFALTSKMRTGLSWAVNNYNAVANMGLNFSLSFGTNFAAADIVVYKVANSSAGASSGLPSGGNPYKWVQINAGTDAFSTNVIEGFMTHEIGHCIGMAHTDGTAGTYIFGTPVTDPNSIYNTTTSLSTNGELSNGDKVALSIIY